MPYQSLHECPSKNNHFVELPEHRSVAKKHLIEAVQALGEKLLIQGVDNKTSYFDYLEHHVPLLGSGIFNEDKRIDSINSGLEFRAGD